MAATRAVDLPCGKVTARELTVAEVRTWLVEVEAGTAIDPLGSMVFDDCSLSDLVRMSDADPDALEGLTHGELLPLRDACKVLNPHFFRVRAALQKVARAIEVEAAAMISTAH
jgi:hypothetical protein